MAGLVGEANSAAGNRVFANDGAVNGDRGGAESGEMPQIQGKVMFQQDLWGKAAYYGTPTPFTAQVVAGVQRNDFTKTSGTVNFFGENGFNTFSVTTNNRYLYPWIVEATTFIPVIPTYSANVAGTASLMTQWYIGQGTEAFGFSGLGSNLLHWSGSGSTSLTRSWASASAATSRASTTSPTSGS